MIELKPGQTPTAKDYNRLIDKVNALSNIKGRNGVRINQTPQGVTIVGQPVREFDAIDSDMVFAATFDSFIGRVARLVSRSTWFGCSTNTFIFGDPPQDGDGLRWEGFNFSEGSYKLVSGFQTSTDYGIMEWLIVESAGPIGTGVQIASVDAYSAPALLISSDTTEFEIDSDLAGVTVDIAMIINGQNVSSSGFGYVLSWFDIRKIS